VRSESNASHLTGPLAVFNQMFTSMFGEVRGASGWRAWSAGLGPAAEWQHVTTLEATNAAPSAGAGEPELRLYLFGPLRAYLGDQLVIDDRFTRRKAKALLAFLYLERGRYVTRDELIETLWPQLRESPADSNRLKQTVLVLRRALEGQRSRNTGWRYILVRDGAYYFNTQGPYQSDLECFQQELRLAHTARGSGDPGRALIHFHRAFALHRTELLPEFRYEAWAANQVTRVHGQYLRALEDAARLHGTSGDYARAVDLLRRAIDEDPLRESSTLQLMEWLRRKGDHTDALRAYSRLRDLLAKRLELEPDPKITALFQEIRRDRAQ
jgi:LuxR family transcriptional regulator, maltose regulon positive regulatory protein